MFLFRASPGALARPQSPIRPRKNHRPPSDRRGSIPARKYAGTAIFPPSKQSLPAPRLANRAPARPCAPARKSHSRRFLSKREEKAPSPSRGDAADKKRLAPLSIDSRRSSRLHTATLRSAHSPRGKKTLSCAKSRPFAAKPPPPPNPLRAKKNAFPARTDSSQRRNGGDEARRKHASLRKAPETEFSRASTKTLQRPLGALMS